MKVFSTKLLDEKTMVYAQSLNLDVRCGEFIKITGVEFDIYSIQPEKFDAVAFTSANAVKYFLQRVGAGDLLKVKIILSLSGKTYEELLKKNIYPNITATNAENLAHLIIQNKVAQSVLHICGHLVLDVLETKLKATGIEYTPLVVYQTILQKDIVLNEEFDAVMFLSPSGVESFFSANKLKDEIVCCCMGQTTATALREKLSNAKIISPIEPSPESMFDALVRYSKTGKSI